MSVTNDFEEILPIQEGVMLFADVPTLFVVNFCFTVAFLT